MLFIDELTGFQVGRDGLLLRSWSNAFRRVCLFPYPRNPHPRPAGQFRFVIIRQFDNLMKSADRLFVESMVFVDARHPPVDFRIELALLQNRIQLSGGFVEVFRFGLREERFGESFASAQFVFRIGCDIRGRSESRDGLVELTFTQHHLCGEVPWKVILRIDLDRFVEVLPSQEEVTKFTIRQPQQNPEILLIRLRLDGSLEEAEQPIFGFVGFVDSKDLAEQEVVARILDEQVHVSGDLGICRGREAGKGILGGGFFGAGLGERNGQNQKREFE